MRRVVADFLLVVVIFLIGPAKAVENAWKPGDYLNYGSKEMFEWLAAKLENDYVIGSHSKVPSFKGETPDGVYFHGDGACELVDLAPAGGAEVEITRGRWKLTDGELVVVLTDIETYGEGAVSKLDPPAVTTFELTDWQNTSFYVSEPTERLFDGIATELKREYLIGAWGNVPYVAGYSAPILLTLKKNGVYEWFYLEEKKFPEAPDRQITTERGTWAIVNNKLELTKTSHGTDGFMKELVSPIVETYEITDLQYVFDIPKEYARPFIQCDGLMYLGQQLTMHIGGIQFWY